MKCIQPFDLLKFELHKTIEIKWTTPCVISIIFPTAIFENSLKYAALGVDLTYGK